MNPEEVEDGSVVRMPKAYPMYDNGWLKQVAIIRNYLETALPNLQLVGRNGMHKYNNQDHSMMTALCAARTSWEPTMTSGRSTEPDYHEEKQGKGRRCRKRNLPVRRMRSPRLCRLQPVIEAAAPVRSRRFCADVTRGYWVAQDKNPANASTSACALEKYPEA